MTRILWFFFGSLGVIALAGLIVAMRQPKPVASGPLTLPDGSVVRVLAATYGTNHVVGQPLARFVAHMPASMQMVAKRLLGRRAALECSTTTTEPRLVVWLARNTNHWTALPGHGYLDAFLSDASGFVSGGKCQLFDWSLNSVQLDFAVFPRRDRVIAVNFFHHSPTGGVTRCGALRFANPVYGKYPEWAPEPLPATRRVGDVAVTLEKLSTGHDHNSGYESAADGGLIMRFGTNRVDGQNNTVCAIRFRSLTNTNEAWLVANEEVSDATGNKARNTSLGWGSYEQGYFTFDPGLWTNESAWELRCEIKRAKGFAPGETFVFRNVSLGNLDATNPVAWRTNFSGVTVTLDHVLRRAPNTNSSWSSDEFSQVQFTTAGLTNGVHLDLLSVRIDSGTNLQSGSWSSGGNERTYQFRDIPLAAKAADFTFAVQQGRWVQFTVKPEVGTGRLKYIPQKGK